MGFTLNPNLLIYRDELLGASETFVLTQAEALQQFRPIYVGLRLVPGLPTPADRRLLLAASGLLGKLERSRCKLVGPAESRMAGLRALRPVLVHAQFGPDGTHAMPIAARLGVPLIVTFHGYDVTMSDESLATHSLTLRLYVRRRTRLAQAGTMFLCASDFLRQRLLTRGFPAERTRVHYIGIDTDTFRADPSTERRNLVLFVGRLIENKGCGLLLRAMRVVQQANPDAELVIIGEGPLCQTLEKQAEQLQLRNYQFLGAQPPAAVRRWMSQARVFCVPSVEVESGASEGFGLVFAEAQSMGVPVVSFRTGGISEAVADGRTGLLAPAREWGVLAKHIALLLTSPGTWERFSAEGRTRSRHYFNLTKQTVALEQIYQQVIAREQPETSCAVKAAGA
jgi:glycosyltransferase involved in cell wall biosynthesis